MGLGSRYLHCLHLVGSEADTQGMMLFFFPFPLDLNLSALEVVFRQSVSLLALLSYVCL